MTSSILRKINRMFGEAFGYSPLGPKYQWMLSTDNRLYYFLDKGLKEIRSPAGIILMEHEYRRVSWADRWGPNVWVVAQWNPPDMTAEQWRSQFKAKFPYPSKGRFAPLTVTKMKPSDPLNEPDAEITAYAIQMIRSQVEKTDAQILSECNEEAAKPFEASRREWEDRVDSDWPAFDNVPGMKLNTSFPSVQKRKPEGILISG